MVRYDQRTQRNDVLLTVKKIPSPNCSIFQPFVNTTHVFITCPQHSSNSLILQTHKCSVCLKQTFTLSLSILTPLCSHSLSLPDSSMLSLSFSISLSHTLSLSLYCAVITQPVPFFSLSTHFHSHLVYDTQFILLSLHTRTLSLFI